MPSIEIKELHNYSRFPNAVPLLLYLPIGILLVVLRLIIFLPVLLLSTVLPNTQFVNGVLLKLLCVTFGISINVENVDKREDVEAYISNQVSVLDHLVIHSLTGSVMPGSKVDTKLSPIFGVKYFGPVTNFETFKSNVALFIGDNKTPLYFQPESAMTNGKALLKFSTWPFTLCSKVQPIVVDVKRPLFNVSVSSVNSTYWTDVLFYMFSPLTVYNVQFLPAAERKGLTEKDFARKMQQDMAKALKVEAVDYSSGDVREWLKRYRMEQRTAQIIQMRPPTTTNITELQRMALQVKEVLPMVPMTDIMRDLAKTRNVDVTITNILEGAVTYVPEQTVSPSSSKTSAEPRDGGSYAPCPPCSSSQGTSKDPFNTAAQSFGKSASERTLSFQERKQQLVENARRRYIEKHGLNIVALNNC